MDSPRGSLSQPELSGWLFKWTNYLRGYQRRWFVLSNGMLSYFRNQNEMSHTCRGSLSLDGAIITSEESCNFVVTNNETYHMRAETELEKQKWISALQLTVAVIEERKFEVDLRGAHTTLNVADLKNKLKDVQSFGVLMDKEGGALQRSIIKLDNSDLTETSSSKLTDVNEKAARLRETTSTMVKACEQFLDLAVNKGEKLETLLHQERCQRIRLEKIVDSLTCQDVRPAVSPEDQNVDPDEENTTFFDCDDSPALNLNEEISTIQAYSAMMGKDTPGTSAPRIESKRRIRIPDRPNISMNLWAVIKNCIGKDITKMPIPVNFCEPLSLLQRLTEDFEYAHILDVASHINDPGEQLAHVSAFAISSYSTTVSRTGKPFNPLLGETFEFDRSDDLGWKSIAEQVSHHPPIAAIYCESKRWEFWQEQSLSTKFRGQYLQIMPTGEVHVKFKNGNHYRWKKVTTNIHNIIIGKLWIDQEGEMEITCLTTGYKSKLHFIPHGVFSRDQRKVSGSVVDGQNEVIWCVEGSWDKNIAISRNTDPSKSGAAKIDAGTVIWERTLPGADSEKYYNMTVFACQLNELEEAIAPTDSRKRPDQRLMEDGKWDQANEVKALLEEKQRAHLKKRDKPTTPEHQDEFEPIWFKKVKDPVSQSEMYVYKGHYWESKRKNDWTRCPEIFSI